jgi:hypothetical protein
LALVCTIVPMYLIRGTVKVETPVEIRELTFLICSDIK